MWKFKTEMQQVQRKKFDLNLLIQTDISFDSIDLPMSMKNITSTIESTTSSETSSEVLFLKATLYGT